MSRGKASLPSRLHRQSRENRPPDLVRPDLLSEFPAEKLGWLDIFEPTQCGYSDITAGNNRDDDGDNNDARHH